MKNILLIMAGGSLMICVACNGGHSGGDGTACEGADAAVQTYLNQGCENMVGQIQAGYKNYYTYEQVNSCASQAHVISSKYGSTRTCAVTEHDDKDRLIFDSTKMGDSIASLDGLAAQLRPQVPTVSSPPATVAVKNQCDKVTKNDRVVLNKDCTKGVILPQTFLNVKLRGLVGGISTCALADIEGDQTYFTGSIVITGRDNSLINDLNTAYASQNVSLSAANSDGYITGALIAPNAGDKLTLMGLRKEDGVFYNGGGLSAQLVLSTKTYCKLTSNTNRDLDLSDLRQIVKLTSVQQVDVYLDGNSTYRTVTQSF